MENKMNGELPEENAQVTEQVAQATETVACEAAEAVEEVAPAAEESEEAIHEETEEITEEVAEEITEEVTAEATEEVAAEATQEAVPGIKEKVLQIWAVIKEKLVWFWAKVKPLREEAEAAEEPAEEAAAEEPAEEAPAEPAAEAPVRRKPADAFALDPLPEETAEEPAEEAAAEESEEATEDAQETSEESQAEETQEVQAAEESAQEDLFAEEETEPVPAKKKIKPLHLGLIIAGGVVLLALLVVFVLKGAGIDLKPRENDLFYKDSYTTDANALVKKADDVVATIDDRELTVSELQLYYINGIYTFYSQNYYYLSMMNLDLTAPLDDQMYPGDENMTWEQFFLDAALKSWQSYTIVEMLAEQENFVVDEYVQAEIDSMASQLESIAAAYGFASAADYLSEEMAPGVSPETYVNFNKVFFICNEFINHLYEENYPNSDEILQYYKENEELFLTNGIYQGMGLMSDVRHILIQPQGGVTDESGETTYSDEEWGTALTDAEQILQRWKEGEATEDSFAAMANTYSADGGSNTTGGLYEDIHIDSSYVPEFKNWAIDASRQVGDTEIVKTTYGYHIMYFVGGQDYFEYLVGEQLAAERIQNKLTVLREANPMEVDYKKIVLGESSFG